MANTTPSKAKTTIELNGKLYDARTGKIISSPAPSTSVVTHQTVSAQPPVKSIVSAPPAATKPKKATGMVLDGFVRGARTHTTARTQPKYQKTALQKSQTLMRPAVQKPQPIAKTAAQNSVPAKKLQFKKKDTGREARAASTPKSSAIRRFKAPAQPATLVKKQAVVPVATQAAPVAPRHAAAAYAPASQRAAQLATTTEAHVKQSVDAIEASLRSATSHLQHFDDSLMKRGFFSRFSLFKSRAANLATLSVAGLLLMGFFAYQNAPNIEMRVAAAQSGVSAQMPGYKPTGFSASRGIKADPGKVTVAFHSNTNNKEFTVTQQASNWSSDALLANHVLASKQPYQTYQNEGKTVFIYDNSNATWVNGGIWYQVNGDASLTSDQLLRLANSF